MFGPYKSSLRVRLRNLIESVCAALNQVTSTPEMMRSLWKTRSLVSVIPTGRQDLPTCPGWQSGPAATPVLVGSAAANRSEMVSPAVYAAQSASRTDRGCSATWPGRGCGSALPASSRGVGGECNTSSSVLACARACQWPGDRDVRVRCMSRSTSSRDLGALHARPLSRFLSRAFDGWLRGLFKGVGDGFFPVHRLSLFPGGLVCRFVQRLAC